MTITELTVLAGFAQRFGIGKTLAALVDTMTITTAVALGLLAVGLPLGLIQTWQDARRR